MQNPRSKKLLHIPLVQKKPDDWLKKPKNHCHQPFCLAHPKDLESEELQRARLPTWAGAGHLLEKQKAVQHRKANGPDQALRLATQHNESRAEGLPTKEEFIDHHLQVLLRGSGDHLGEGAQSEVKGCCALHHNECSFLLLDDRYSSTCFV